MIKSTLLLKCLGSLYRLELSLIQKNHDSQYFLPNIQTFFTSQQYFWNFSSAMNMEELQESQSRSFLYHKHHTYTKF